MVFDTSAVFNSEPSILDEVSIPSWFKTISPPIEHNHGTPRQQPPKVHVLSIGGAGSGIGWHMHGEAWLASVHGRKKWTLSKPGGMMASKLGSPLMGSPEWSKRYGGPIAGLIKFVHNEGQTLYLPAGWWHTTINIDQCIAFGGQQVLVPHFFLCAIFTPF